GEPLVELVDLRTDIETEIGRHLVVARARRVQPPGGRPDQFGEPRLDVHMNILERPLEAEPALLDLFQDVVEPANDLAGVLLGDDAAPAQHPGMGLARQDILAEQAAVDVYRGVDLRHDGSWSRRKAPAPHLVAHGPSTKGSIRSCQSVL